MKLNDKHLSDLRSSGLSDADIERSGCYSVTRQQATVILGFDPMSDGLAFPYPSVNGKSKTFVRVKPDTPYQAPGWKKAARYLTPKGAPNHLYIPPTLDASILQDPFVSMILVEGEKKALKAVAEGFPGIALSGVWSWTSGRDTGTGQRHPIPDLNLVMWKGRTVFLIFDSDAATNRKVRQAEKALADHLKGRGADVRIVRLPTEPDGSKNGLDDFLARHGKDALQALMDREGPEDQEDDDIPDPSGLYVVKGGVIGYMKSVGRGDDTTRVFVPLCNFTAKVTEETARDNGVEVVKTFSIEGRLNDGKTLPRTEVPASQFAGLTWVTGSWGISARISAGTASKDRLREAIQVFSANAATRTVFTHTGWRKMGAPWLYLHAGGAIGANGQAVDVDLEPPLNRYQLPATLENIVEAVKLSLSLLDAAPYAVTVPLLCIAYLAPLCEILHPDFALWLLGSTGVRKSTLAALFLSHYGNFPDKNALPASWESTENALEKRLFMLKDTLCVIDDYAPKADPTAQAKMSRVAQRLVRAQGNLSGRSRMRADTSLRPDYPPRGLTISTGEDLPPGESVMARLLTVEIAEQIDSARLTPAQDQAHRLPHAMAGYLQWLAPQMDELRERLPAMFKEKRKEARACASHPRTPEIVAYLAVGLEMFLKFAVHVEAVSEEQADRLYSDGWDTLLSVAQAHDRRVRQEDPAEVFLQTLASLLAQNAVHVAPRDTVGEGDGGGVEIGWMDESYLYLIPDATRAAVARCLRDAGGHFPHSPRMLYKALERKGALVPGKDQATRFVKIGPKSRRVIQPQAGVRPRRRVAGH